MRARPDRFYLDRAPSSCARCRKCDLRIEKGAARLSALCFVSPGRNCKTFRHVDCAGPEEVRRILAQCGALEGLPSAIRGAERQQVLRRFAALVEGRRDLGELWRGPEGERQGDAAIQTRETPAKDS